MKPIDNPIFKRFRGSWTYPISDTGSSGQGKASREWCAVCPVCREEISTSGTRYYGVGTRPTRKTAKDALHWHRKTKQH